MLSCSGKVQGLSLSGDQAWALKPTYCPQLVLGTLLPLSAVMWSV